MAFDMSKAAFGKASIVSNLDRIQMIDIYDIDINDKNFYSIEGIEELAESIKMVGLLDPVRVVPLRVTDDQPYKFKLISGHRRHQAYQYLFDTEETGWDRIPALVVSAMDDLTETFALITANSTARELSYAEKLKQEQLLRETLTAMKEAGKEVPKNLGQYIADQIGTNRNEVSRMHSINAHLIPEAREKLDKGEMTAQQGYELSRKPEAEQREAVTVKEKQEPDAIGALNATIRAESLLKFARNRLEFWAAHAAEGLTRSDAIKALQCRHRNSGYGGPGKCDGYYTAASGKVRLDNFHFHATWTEVWDALAIAALEFVSKLDTEDEADVSPAPAAQLWHAADEPPKQDGSYVCMYRGTGDAGYIRRALVMQYEGSAWRMHGNPVEEVYTILKWTEVPEC